jgi:hypothetical protein
MKRSHFLSKQKGRCVTQGNVADRIWAEDGNQISIQLMNKQIVVLTVTEILNALVSMGVPVASTTALPMMG